ncbi:hypothetical protein [Brevibacterium sp. UCMA 11754]|uniref:hypothetical protein n=1 Tax=Brevibacterium sp. UCMA 11754 TaxID=2749198 RepID=UPI001F1B79FC|nr:hypothetical protein [Brevibacterium sp. UCMA 11754]MCF2572038.1 hypothetical protein [Brevibacterium sp. UCMA 11754]
MGTRLHGAELVEFAVAECAPVVDLRSALSVEEEGHLCRRRDDVRGVCPVDLTDGLRLGLVVVPVVAVVDRPCPRVDGRDRSGFTIAEVEISGICPDRVVDGEPSTFSTTFSVSRSTTETAPVFASLTARRSCGSSASSAPSTYPWGAVDWLGLPARWPIAVPGTR